METQQNLYVKSDSVWIQNSKKQQKHGKNEYRGEMEKSVLQETKHQPSSTYFPPSPYTLLQYHQ